jgi:acyl dehydratase
MKYKDFTEFKSVKGKTFAPTTWLEVTQEMINHFACATHDHQWIHTDEKRASIESPYQKTIAHGFLSLGLITKFLSDSVQVATLKMGFNYGLDTVRFPHPVVVGSFLRGLVTVEDIENQRFGGLKIIWKVIIEIKDVKKPACVAQMTTLAYE